MLLNGWLLFDVKWRCLWHFQKRQDCRYSRTQTVSARSAASNLFTQTIDMASVVHGRHTTGLPWLRAAMIQHRMARRFALIVTKIHILSAASNLIKKTVRVAACHSHSLSPLGIVVFNPDFKVVEFDHFMIVDVRRNREADFRRAATIATTSRPSVLHRVISWH